jgi:arginase
MSNIALVGIPYDSKSSFMRGPSTAPQKIRECLYSNSTNMFAENGLSIQNDIIKDHGDIEINNYFEIADTIGKFLADSNRIVSFGGDHSITYPILKAYSNFHSDIEILHIDAHADLYDILDGDKYSHACPFARIMEESLASRLVQLGIRTLNDHQIEQSRKFGTEIVEMKDFTIKKIPAFNLPVYLSIDLDGIDPAFAPGVSHHEPGGFTSRDVISIIQSIKGPIIGADIVELNPIRDSQGITAALAAKLCKEILSKMLETDNA